MPALVWPPVAGSADDAKPRGPIELDDEAAPPEEDDGLLVSPDP